MKKLVKSISPFVLAILLQTQASAQTTTLYMDEAAPQTLDGLHVADVSFAFSVDGLSSQDASFNAYGVGDLAYVSDPSIEGSTSGVLSVQFDMPVSQISFGVALQSEYTLTDAVSVTLRASDHHIISTNWLSTTPVFVFSEGLFEYVGSDISSMDITFSIPAIRFALDQLSYTVSAVPEPSTAALMCLGLLVCLAHRQTRRHPRR
jgi:hypothetical protein